MLHHGIALILSAGPALAGVLHALHRVLVCGLHEAFWRDPLTPVTTWVERRHMRRPCAECSLIAEMHVSRLG